MHLPVEQHAAILSDTWKFVRERFAFQAKQLKSWRGPPLAQCYDQVANIHGYSSWRDFLRVLAALETLDTQLHLLDEPLEAQSGTKFSELCLAACALPDDFPFGVDGLFDGRQVEDCLRQARPGIKALHVGHDVLDPLFQGLTEWEYIREHVLYQSAWLGAEGPISAHMIEVLDDAMTRLAMAGESWPQAVAIVSSLYGIEGGDVQDAFEQSSSSSIKRFNRALTASFNAGQPLGLDYDTFSAFQAAKQEQVRPVSAWRAWLRHAHPSVLDGRVESGSVTCLVLGNAPDNCWAQLGLSFIYRGHKSKPVQWFGVWSIFAPDAAAASKAAATSPSCPQLQIVSPEYALELGQPELAGYLELRYF